MQAHKRPNDFTKMTNREGGEFSMDTELMVFLKEQEPPLASHPFPKIEFWIFAKAAVYEELLWC